MKEFAYCTGLADFFGFGDNCSWTVLLIGAYFFLSNGCLEPIFNKPENSIVWIILLFIILFVYNKKIASSCTSSITEF